MRNWTFNLYSQKVNTGQNRPDKSVGSGISQKLLYDLQISFVALIFHHCSIHRKLCHIFELNSYILTKNPSCCKAKWHPTMTFHKFHGHFLDLYLFPQGWTIPTDIYNCQGSASKNKNSSSVPLNPASPTPLPGTSGFTVSARGQTACVPASDQPYFSRFLCVSWSGFIPTSTERTWG